MGMKIEVGVLGATGMVGQEFITQLSGHPWFSVKWLGASERSEGKAYQDATAWRLAVERPDWVAGMKVNTVAPGLAPKLLFSGLDASVAGVVEESFAKAGHIVVSNARNHRMDPLVPLVIPEVNSDHLALLRRQGEVKGWSGRILTNPNCSTVVLAMVLAPLRRFGLDKAVVSTLQAISGGGYPGVPSLDVVGNVIPFISGEESKIETETQKILGRIVDGEVKQHPLTVSATTTRVPVINGHTELVSVSLPLAPSSDQVVASINEFKGVPQELDLPSAPSQPLRYMESEERPQPRLDAGCGGGMVVSVGRFRTCPVMGYKFVAMGHNTIRGAAGVAVLNAELLKAKGFLD